MTHDDRSRTEYCDLWTKEAVSLTGRAKVLDVREHPSLYSELHSASDDRRDELTPEHRTMWDLHIMTEFEGAGTFKCLHHGNSAPCF